MIIYTLTLPEIVPLDGDFPAANIFILPFVLWNIICRKIRKKCLSFLRIYVHLKPAGKKLLF